MPIKATMSYQLTPLRMAIIKRSSDKKMVEEVEEGAGTFAHSLWVGSYELESSILEMGPVLLLNPKRTMRTN